MGSTRQNFAVVYAYVSKDDHARLTAIASGADETMASLIRGCIEDYLEVLGEDPLEALAPRGRPRVESQQRN